MVKRKDTELEKINNSIRRYCKLWLVEENGSVSFEVHIARREFNLVVK